MFLIIMKKFKIGYIYSFWKISCENPRSVMTIIYLCIRKTRPNKRNLDGNICNLNDKPSQNWLCILFPPVSGKI